MSSIPSIALPPSEDKENQSMASLPVVNEGQGVTTPTRTPLKQVNRTPVNSSQLFLKRAQYSQVTPFSTPPSKSRHVKQGTPVSLHLPGKSPSTRDVHLNLLIYKKVTEMISKKEKEHEAVLEQKQELITLLEQQVQALSLTKTESRADSENKQDAGTCMSAPGTPVLHREKVDRSSSPYPTPTMIRPLLLPHENLLTTASGPHSVPLAKFTLEDSSDIISHSEPDRPAESVAEGKNCGNIDENVSSVSTLVDLENVKALKSRSIETMVTPVRQVSTYQMTSPIVSTDKDILSVKELVKQQEQLLSDLTSLRGDLQQRDDMSSLKTSYEQRLAELDGEIVALKHSITSGYQQRKQEIEALRLDQDQADYKGHYMRSREEVQKLKLELHRYVSIVDELEQSQCIMGDAAEAVQNTYDKLQKSVQSYNVERSQWQQEVAKWEAEKCGILEENMKLTERVKQVEQERSQKLAALSQVDKAAIEKLTKDLSDVKKALAAQSVLAADLTKERDRYRSLSECQRLCNTALQEDVRKARGLQKQTQQLEEEIASVTSCCERQMVDLIEEVEFLRAEHVTQEAELADVLKAREDLSGELTTLQDELNETKLKTHLKMLEQGEELTASHWAVTEFTHRCCQLEGLLGKVERYWNASSTTPQNIPKDCQEKKREKKQKRDSRKSFVYQVLMAASGQDESLAEDTSCDVLEYAIPEDVEEKHGETDAADKMKDELELPLNERIEQLNAAFDHIINTFKKVEDSVKLAVSELQDKLAVSERNLQKTRESLTKVLDEAEECKLELTQLHETDLKQKATVSKCRSQVWRLNHNWKAAEAELQEVAEINETVRKVLCEHQAEIKSWPEDVTLRNLGMVGDGDSEESPPAWTGTASLTSTRKHS